MKLLSSHYRQGPCLQQRFNGILEYVASQIQDVVAMKLLQTCLKHKQRVTRKVGNGFLESRRGKKIKSYFQKMTFLAKNQRLAKDKSLNRISTKHPST
jgi:hypothetical protein